MYCIPEIDKTSIIIRGRIHCIQVAKEYVCKLKEYKINYYNFIDFIDKFYDENETAIVNKIVEYMFEESVMFYENEETTKDIFYNIISDDPKIRVIFICCVHDCLFKSNIFWFKEIKGGVL